MNITNNFSKTQQAQQNLAFKKSAPQLRDSVSRWLVDNKKSRMILGFKDEVPEKIAPRLYETQHGGRGFNILLGGSQATGKTTYAKNFTKGAEHNIYHLESDRYIKRCDEARKMLEDAGGRVNFFKKIRKDYSVIFNLDALEFDMKYPQKEFLYHLIEGIAARYINPNLVDMNTLLKVSDKTHEKRFDIKAQNKYFNELREVYWENSQAMADYFLKQEHKMDIIFNGEVPPRKIQALGKSFAEAIKPEEKSYHMVA